MAKTAAQIQAMLDEVDDAILEILQNGQSISINGRTYTRASLDTLYKLQEQYERQISRVSGVRRTVAEF